MNGLTLLWIAGAVVLACVSRYIIRLAIRKDQQAGQEYSALWSRRD